MKKNDIVYESPDNGTTVYARKIGETVRHLQDNDPNYLKYLKEQVEEHNKMQDLVDQLEAFGEDKIAMRLFDHELKDYL